MKYTCIGFSENDRALIQQQFSVLKNKLNHEWVFSKTSDRYDLMIVNGRRPPENISSELTAIIGAPANSEKEISIEWPLRIFDLLDLINKAESPQKNITKTQVSTSSFSFANTIKEYLSESSQPLIFALNTNDYICIDLNRGKVLMTQNKTLDTLKSVLAVKDSEIKTLGVEHLSQIKWKAAKPLKSFMWSLALRESAMDVYGWDINRHSFQIKRFPSLGEWESSPFMLRLASLYTRRDCTIKLAMDFCKIDANQVAAFLHACNMIDAGLIIKSVKSAEKPDTPHANETVKYSSIFSQVRNKLGTVFGSLSNG